MEYKIFGPAGWPSDDFKERLKTLRDINDEQRSIVVYWFLATHDYDLTAPSLPPEAGANTLLPQEFDSAARAVYFLLDSWQRYGLDLPDIERDLLLLGCNQEQVNAISRILERLSSVKGRVWIDSQHSLQIILGLPTITDVNIVLDARPVFGGLPYIYRSDNSSEGAYRRFLGLTYIAIMEVHTSDSDGQKQRTAFQMDEEQVKRLSLGLKRASEQLDILKERTSSLALNTKNAENGE